MPNISEWNIGNLLNINGLFYGCSSVLTFPDISKCNLPFLIRKEDIFDFPISQSEYNSNYLSISKNTINENINDFFEDCFSLINSNSNQKIIKSTNIKNSSDNKPDSL